MVGDEEIRKYLWGSLADLYEPRLLKDMDKAVGLLQEKMEQGVKIRIIGDYDADGIVLPLLIRHFVMIRNDNRHSQFPCTGYLLSCRNPVITGPGNAGSCWKNCWKSRLLPRCAT